MGRDPKGIAKCFLGDRRGYFYLHYTIISIEILYSIIIIENVIT